MKLFTCLLFIAYSIKLFSQDPDYTLQLKNIAAITDKDKKIDSLEKFTKFLVFQDPEMAIVAAKKLMGLTKNIKTSKAYLTSYNALGLASLYTDHNENAVKYLDTLVKLAVVQRDTVFQSKGYGNLGLVYERLGNFKKAFTNYSLALRTADLLKNKSLTASSYGNLGNVSIRLFDYQAAVLYLKNAANIFDEFGPEKSLANQYNSLAQAYGGLKDKVNNKLYLLKAEKIYREIGERKALGTVLTNLGSMEADEHNYREAVKIFEEALAIKIEMEDAGGQALILINLSSIYADLGQFNKASASIERANEIAKNQKDLYMQSEVVLKRAMLLRVTGHYREAYNVLLNYMRLKDAVVGRETQLAVADYKEKYESEKKEFEIDRLTKLKEIDRLKIKQNEEQLDKEKARRHLIIGVLSFTVVLFLVLMWAFINKRKNNDALTLKNSQLEHANVEISHQKEEIMEKQIEILDSIYYARRIQQALLAHKDFVTKHIEQNFIYFKPKDIVSGDFYWATEHSGNFYLAVCDSTGHGVPGAFMSLLNIGFLSEAIKEKEITKPNEIFNYVRQRLIESVNKDEQQDGMDGILLCINKTTREITYSAAYNAPVLIRNTVIVELPKDKMPIGKGEKPEGFTLHHAQVQPGDSLYLYTDGYADQFGGTKGKKFKSRTLNELLLSVNKLTLLEQEKKINQTFLDWKGNLEQVDDVCIIGIRL